MIISFSDLVSMCKKNTKEFLLLNKVRKAKLSFEVDPLDIEDYKRIYW